MVAVGSYSAGTHIVHIDGGYGGTGAAPDIAKKNIAMPIEYAIGKVHGFLDGRGRPRQGDPDGQRRHPRPPTISPRPSPWAPTAWSSARRNWWRWAACGAAAARAAGAVRAASPPPTRNCPAKMDLDWGTQRIINLYNAWREELVDILRRFGMRSVSELRGRTDLLMHLDYTNDVEQ